MISKRQMQRSKISKYTVKPDSLWSPALLFRTAWKDIVMKCELTDVWFCYNMDITKAKRKGR